jgi:hypothetical protein
MPRAKSASPLFVYLISFCFISQQRFDLVQQARPLPFDPADGLAYVASGK